MKIAIPDLISNSYLPAVAAVDLGFFKDEGLDMEFELIFPFDKTLEALRDDEIDFAVGASHAVPFAFPNWDGAKLLCAVSHGMYWFLVLRPSLGAGKGDIDAVKGCKIGAAPLVDLGLKQMLIEHGIDLEKDHVDIGPVPGAFQGDSVNFGVAAAQALKDGKIDGFWANGMGTEVAVRNGAGVLVADVRRGDGPPKAFNFTQPALVAKTTLIEQQPDVVEAAMRAMIKTQKALIDNPDLATDVGRKRFQQEEANLIAELVARDTPFYKPHITPDFIAGMSEFSQNAGLIDHPVSYEQAVATQFANLWDEI